MPNDTKQHKVYRIVGNFRGGWGKIFVVEQYLWSVRSWILSSWLLLTWQVKVASQRHFIRGSWSSV